MDVSKSEGATGAEQHCKEQNENITIYSSKYANIFQAEVYTVFAYMDTCLEDNTKMNPYKFVQIIGCIGSTEGEQIVFVVCTTLYYQANSSGKIIFIWVPGYNEIP